MKKTQISHISDEMILTKETIKTKLELSDFDYNAKFFYSAMTFLERIFPQGTEEYEIHSRSKLFWNWYALQYHASAQSFLSRAATLRHISNMNIKILNGLFQNDMAFFCIHSIHISRAFENYLNVYQKYGTKHHKAA